MLLGYLVFHACYALAGFCTLTAVTAAYLKFVPTAERTSNMTVKPKGAKNKGHMLSCQSLQWGLQAYLSLPCMCVPETVLCLCMQSSDFAGAQMLGETFLEPLVMAVDVV